MIVTVLDEPAGSVNAPPKVAFCPSGNTIVPKSPATGALPSSVSTFSLKVTMILSINPLKSVSYIARLVIVGAIFSVKLAVLFD